MNALNKVFMLILLCSVVASMPAMDENKGSKSKKRKGVSVKKSRRAKRVKVTSESDVQFGHVCPECGTEWLAQTDECPGCGKLTGLGDDFYILNGRFFVPK